MRMNSRVKAFTFTRYDKSELDQIKNTQDLLPFKGITRNRIDLGNHDTVAYVKVRPSTSSARRKMGLFAIRLRRAFARAPSPRDGHVSTRARWSRNDMLARLSKTIDETVSGPTRPADEYFKRLEYDQHPGTSRRVPGYPTT